MQIYELHFLFIYCVIVDYLHEKIGYRIHKLYVTIWLKNLSIHLLFSMGYDLLVERRSEEHLWYSYKYTTHPVLGAERMFIYIED